MFTKEEMEEYARQKCLKLEKALVSLTPGGSEFCDDPDYCVKYVKEFQDHQHKLLMNFLLKKDSIGVSKSEADFIVEALNFYWHEASKKLAKPEELGDIEKMIYQQQLDRSKELMTNLDKL